MPKAIIDSVRGVNQIAGEGLSVTGMPITYSTSSTALTNGQNVPRLQQTAKVTVSGTTVINLLNPDASSAAAGIGTVKVIVVDSAASTPALQLKNQGGGSHVNSLSASGASAVPGTVQAGDSFVCVYVAAGEWTLLE